MFLQGNIISANSILLQMCVITRHENHIVSLT